MGSVGRFGETSLNEGQVFKYFILVKQCYLLLIQVELGITDELSLVFTVQHSLVVFLFYLFEHQSQRKHDIAHAIGLIPAESH